MLNERMRRTIAGIAESPRVAARNLINGSRAAARASANVIQKAKKPARKLANTGLKINEVGFEASRDLMKQQIDLVEDLMDDSAKRLTAAARADNLRSLVGDQVALMGETRERIGGDARKTISILSDTRDEIVVAVRSGLSETRDAVMKNKTAPKNSRKKRASAGGRRTAPSKKRATVSAKRKTVAKKRAAATVKRSVGRKKTAVRKTTRSTTA